MTDKLSTDQEPVSPSRRKLMLAGASLAAAPLLAGAGFNVAQAAEKTPEKGPFRVRAFGTKGAKAGFESMHIQRRAVGPKMY
ncbi:hypothetical protein P4A93_01670 [Pseudomonas syringae pv. syringae]|uniref:hypothetical protein n=1 Tax=Pseudomonas syringae TaxID=317 RepID=UPI0023F9F67A|nr:hypothetical protein [Pseudomonas syringae]MDF5890335.1 hypothetical protein [Pseudomonas syringae pv. syringae]